jgi:hydroxypyruvate reductase
VTSVRLSRALAEAVLREVITACDPEHRVRVALGEPPLVERLDGRRRLGLAVGKAALAMARGAGEVADGIAVVPAGGAGALPRGWRAMEATPPVPDDRSVAAGAALRALVAGAGDGDAVLALISGGASALAELPAAGPAALGELVATVQQVMAAGAAIHEINAVRGALSAIKAGRLALASAAPVVTLAVSDVIGDPIEVIGSGPTIGPWLGQAGPVDDGAAATWRRAREVLGRLGLPVPAALDREPPVRQVDRPSDRARVIAPMVSAAQIAVRALGGCGVSPCLIGAPVAGDVAAVAEQLAEPAGPRVAWGEPTVRIPAVHGVGGRAQQLALELARRLRGTPRGALVVGTDGVDGPPPPDRPSPAGAWVDGATWDAIAAAGIDPAAALAACDAGTALAAVGALVVTGPTGINHADLILID